MAGPAIDYHYRYLFPSEMELHGKPQLRLATFTDDETHPYFFTGQLRKPYQAARLLMSLVWLLRMRFHTRPDMIPAGVADPIVTAHDGFLRLEVFSACCSVYARVDLPENAIDGETTGRGATNVDFNPAMIAALSKIRPSSEMRLCVGADEVALESGPRRVVEKRVPLPLRWLKGLLAVTPYSSRLKRVHQVDGAQAVRFLRAIPRRVDHRSRWWVCKSGAGLRLSQRPSEDAVETGGLERLRVLEDLAHMATRLRVYGCGQLDASSWELDFGDARFTMLMTHDVWRGLSGEGQALEQRTTIADDDSLQRVKAALRWQAMISPNDIVKLGGDLTEAVDGLAQLASQGLVGYDAAAEHYYHRELPFDLQFVERLQPRLISARRLVESGGVKELGGGKFAVRGSDAQHNVRTVASELRCTCPWYAKHQNRRGPCKHILAVQMIKELKSGS